MSPLRDHRPTPPRYPLGRRALRSLLERTPYQLTRRFPLDTEPATAALVRSISPYTLSSPARLLETINGTEYVIRAGIEGAMVECGVWRGGNMMAVASTLLRHGFQDRHLYLFDTFEGMSEPTEDDVMFGTELSGRAEWERSRDGHSNAWVRAPLESVREAMLGTGYPADHIHFVKGKVEDTLPADAPDSIALLRLDTDFYESTKHELVHLFPRLQPGGILILDDYGSWRGARKATDEYFAETGTRVFLSQTEGGGRSAVKQ